MILSVVNYDLSLENTEHNGKNGGNKLHYTYFYRVMVEVRK